MRHAKELERKHGTSEWSSVLWTTAAAADIDMDDNQKPLGCNFSFVTLYTYVSVARRASRASVFSKRAEGVQSRQGKNLRQPQGAEPSFKRGKIWNRVFAKILSNGLSIANYLPMK